MVGIGVICVICGLNHKTINPIERHVDHKPDSDNPGLFKNGQCHIYNKRCIRMERMEPDTAAIRIVDRIGKEMIKIDDHCRNHDKPGISPLFRKRHSGNDARYDKVKK